MASHAASAGSAPSSSEFPFAVHRLRHFTPSFIRIVPIRATKCVSGKWEKEVYRKRAKLFERESKCSHVAPKQGGCGHGCDTLATYVEQSLGTRLFSILSKERRPSRVFGGEGPIASSDNNVTK